MDEGLIDSTGILELVSHLEESYGIEILEEELTPDNLDSVNRIAAYLTRKLGRGAPAPLTGERASEAISQVV
jgi:acyl carrier protein